MPKCPHCGETLHKGQEICFACGQHVQERAHRGERPHNAAVFVFAGVLVLAAVIGLTLMLFGRAKRTSAEARRQERTRLEEATRAATQVKRDSARTAARSDASAMLVEEINDLD